MSRVFAALSLLALGAAAVRAQAAPAADNPSVAAVGMYWDQITGFITQAAKDMPEERYAYQPTPEVRTFGRLIGHVAGAQRMICAVAMGETPSGEADIERTVTTKAGLVAAMEASTEYCRRAYAQADAASRAPAELFGSKVTRFHALTLNATHNAEHYGNIVTYLRINGIVPPSSRGGM